ncbi:hypothetical protein [Allomesorhizobium alhagi]|uniref:Uncharacterized protein n=1 Tax=Mesorhizobium alhagi CCNWXJ12-2 TaxID=1107882 RepID=H0HNG1_9HYPH|nr:hypothetical protein [Mesorhizobium alhagi]EHK57733.1 hypothetical protein MAXJ12_08419 [Mesorhizobium alhagi CCNWXJ12-2]
MNETTPVWKRKSAWALALGFVAIGGLVVGAFTLEDAGSIVELAVRLASLVL